MPNPTQNPTIMLHSRQTRALLSQTLQRFIDDDRLSVEELADVCGCSATTVYRWVRGEAVADAHELRAIARASTISMDVRLAIVGIVTNETPLRLSIGDAQPARGLPDAVRSSLEAACHSTAMAKRVAEVAQDRIVTPEEAADVRELVNRLRVEADTVLQVIDRTCTAPRLVG